ncbi:hypothetical protein HNQ92_002170 [Rhabdobacter roseus]|uniref:Uncharacterized protein n=1 Tax=Rhabdobacter roseus TaxID=1655419 RepID=A0A840TQN3_9BACT|nr:hypothetical protein [Rhabdobacter roseus]MBB5284027.1 hypothetical protein [Rhabdobacter roseus]
MKSTPAGGQVPGFAAGVLVRRRGYFNSRGGVNNRRQRFVSWRKRSLKWGGTAA